MKVVITVVAFIALFVVLALAWNDRIHERERAADALARVSVLEGQMQEAEETIKQSESAHAVASQEAASQKAARVALERHLATLKAQQPVLPPVAPDTCAPWAAAVAAKDSIIRVADGVIAEQKVELKIATDDNTQLVATLGRVRRVLADTSDALGKARKVLTDALVKPSPSVTITNPLKKLLPTINVGVESARFNLIEKKFEFAPAVSVQVGWRVRF